MPWQRRQAPEILLVAVLVLAAALIVVFAWDLTFFQDTWAFLLERRGHSVGDFLRPHNEHLVVLQVLLTKILENVFGLTSAHPEMFAMTASLVAVDAILFVYLRRRVGAWLALAAVLPVAFLGSAWMVLLWPFEIEFTATAAAGLASLLMLERGDRRSDLIGCLLLIVSVGFGSLGLSFGFAAAVAVWQTRRTLGWGRGYVVAVPLILYLGWYAGWGHTAEHHVTLLNVLQTPRYVMEGLASSAGSIFGLNTEKEAGTGDPAWGRVIILLLIVGAVAWKRRRPGISPFFWRSAAATASYWILAGASYYPGREAAANRYVFAGAIFLLMMAADLLDGVRVERRVLTAVFAVAALAVVPNVGSMKEGSDVLKGISKITRADLAAIQIAHRTVSPDTPLEPEFSGALANVAIVPGPYLEVSGDHGSPAYTPTELVEGSSSAQHWADVLLAHILPLSLEVLGPGSKLVGSCSSAGAEGGEPEVQVKAGVAYIAAPAGGEAIVTARRFSTTEFPAALGSVPPGSVARLRIPSDEATQPWFLKIESPEPSRVCQ